MAEDNNGWSAFCYSQNKDKKEMKIWFDRDAVLGRGGFYAVVKGKFGGREVAVKRVELYRANKREEEAMLKLDHPNIVKLLHCESDKDFMYYALELCVASLDQLFLDPDDPKKYDGPMPHHTDALLQLASGLECIHSKNLVHRDISPGNVLISVGSGGKDEIILKWSDFGHAKPVNERGTFPLSGIRGNGKWFAPETVRLLRQPEKEEDTYRGTVKSDVFAQALVFGCLLLNGKHLYGSMKNVKEIHDNLIKGNPINMKKIDGKLRVCYENDLLKKMLEHDPDKRMTSTQVVNQLKAIKDKISGKEKELLELCGRDSRSDLTEKIQKLIQFGINLNAKDDGGRNALHLLCRSYSSPKLTDAIQLLIENKINVNAKDNDGLNAIHFLCRFHSSQNLIEAIQILIQSGTDAKATTNDGSNALHYLYRYNSNPNLLDAIKIFTKLGLDLMAEDNNGWSALYYLHNKDKKEMKIWFDRDALLGQGGLGAVFKGKFGGREVAVKRVEVHRVKEREEDTMMKLGHPNIVKLLHCESDKDFRYHALELCDASLDKLFLDPDDPKKYKGPLPRHIEVFHQLADGLAYIHSENLVHRDIKPGNVLISVRSTGQGNVVTIKWADFRLSKPVNERGTCQLSGIRGTKIWFAPETVRLSRQPEKEDTYRGTVKSDVFAQALVFGCLLLNGKHLYGGGEKEIHDNLIGKKPVNMKNIDAKLRHFYEKDLLSKMLEDDPQKRITSEQVVEQLNSINKMFTEKEEELRQLCYRDSSSRLIKKIKDLILLGIDVNAKDGDGWNALHCLCLNDSNSNLIDAIQLLVQGGIDINAKDEDGWNALHHLCSNNSSPHLIEAIKVLIDLGIDKDAKEKDGWNALHLLCSNNKSPQLIEAIKVLIELGIDKDAKTGKGWNNALHLLCANSSSPHLIEAIQELIELGIDKDAKNNDGRNALHLLCQSHSSSNLIKEIKRLIELGYKVNDKDKDGRNALHYLCQDNSSSNLVEAIKLFVENRIDMNAKDNAEWNALHYLCRFNSSSDLRDVIQILIQHGIDVKEKTDDGCNALHFLCQNHSTSNLIGAIQILIQHGINVNEKNNNGWNALYFFIRNSSMDKLLKANVFRFLIRHGIQVHCENEESSNLYQDFFKENDNWGKTCFDFLVKEEIRLGWHDACKNCQQILSITESPRVRLQHHQMFSGCYGVFHLLMKHLEQWAKSNQRPGESELDMSNPTKWLREKAEQYPESETEKSFREDFEFMADVSEQVKKGSNSSEFNCDKYERYLKSMYSIAEMIVSNESMGQIKWFYLLPFDFPIDYGNEKESDIKRAKIEWDKTLFSWTHTETDEDYGTFMKEDANDGFFLPKEFKHKCHGGT